MTARLDGAAAAGASGWDCDPVISSAIDELDQKLIARLRENGRETNRALARRMNVSEVTIATRLRRLDSEGFARVSAITDIRLFGHRELAVAMFTVSDRPVVEVARRIADLPETMTVTVCTGRFGIIALLLARDRAHLSTLFGTVLPLIDGVRSVDGSLALDVVKHDSRWGLFSVDSGSAPDTQPNDHVDPLDLAIIGLLQANARRSNRQLAIELEVSEGTVRARVKRMLADRVFRFQAVSDIAAFGYATFAIVGINTVPGTVDNVTQLLSTHPDVTQITRLMGIFDLLAVLVAKDQATLLSRVIDEVAMIPGVRQTETFCDAVSVKYSYAWTWIV